MSTSSHPTKRRARVLVALAALPLMACPIPVAPLVSFDDAHDDVSDGGSVRRDDAGDAPVDDADAGDDGATRFIAWLARGERDAGDAVVDGGERDDAGTADVDAGVHVVVDAGAPWPGVTFRVWAPHAESVRVAGTWNGWSTDAHPLVDTGDDHFELHVDEALPGHEYKLVIENDGALLWRADPRAQAMTSSVGNSIVVDHDAYVWEHESFAMPARDTIVIYEMHIGTFHDEPGDGVGTFASAIDKLDHLSMLGVNAVHVMPVAEFAGDYSWGYNSASIFAPESAYGTPDDLKRFVDECHARGIAVLIDVVNNHWGPSDLPLWCFDGECLGEDNGGVYFYTGWRRETGWGPRPDFGRVEVRDFILDNTRHWLETYRMDGMRWDSTVNIRSASGVDLPEGFWLLQQANDLADALGGDKLMIAEDLHTNAWITRTTGEGGAGFDSQWDATFFHPVNAALITPSDDERSMWAIRDAIVSTGSGFHTGRVVYTESHDEVANGRQRIPSMISPDDPTSFAAKKRSTLGAGLVMTTPGIPMIFQGQEMLEDEWFRDTDPLDWQKSVDHAGIVALYRDLIALRKNTAGKTAGLTGAGVHVHHVNDGAKVIAYHRAKYGGVHDDVLVVANFSAVDWATYDFGAPAPGTYEVVMNTDDQAYDASYAGAGSTGLLSTTSEPIDGMAQRLRVSLPAYTMLILARVDG